MTACFWDLDTCNIGLEHFSTRILLASYTMNPTSPESDAFDVCCGLLAHNLDFMLTCSELLPPISHTRYMRHREANRCDLSAGCSWAVAVHAHVCGLPFLNIFNDARRARCSNYDERTTVLACARLSARRKLLLDASDSALSSSASPTGQLSTRSAPKTWIYS